MALITLQRWEDYFKTIVTQDRINSQTDHKI